MTTVHWERGHSSETVSAVGVATERGLEIHVGVVSERGMGDREDEVDTVTYCMIFFGGGPGFFNNSRSFPVSGKRLWGQGNTCKTTPTSLSRDGVGKEESGVEGFCGRGLLRFPVMKLRYLLRSFASHTACLLLNISSLVSSSSSSC